MRRLLIALLVSLAAVVPGLARRADPPQGRPDREAAKPNPRAGLDETPAQAPRGASPPPVGPAVGRPQRAQPWRGTLDGAPGGPGGACIADFQVDISHLFVNQPSGTWVVVTGDCSGIPSCGHYVSFACSAGSLVQASFCDHGGNAGFDTDLSIWTGGSQDACATDTCGPPAEISWVADDFAYRRLRIGATQGTGGSYDLAVNMPSTCSIGPPVAVELQRLTVD